jgi:hypothetical protein
MRLLPQQALPSASPPPHGPAAYAAAPLELQYDFFRVFFRKFYSFIYYRRRVSPEQAKLAYKDACLHIVIA